MNGYQFVGHLTLVLAVMLLGFNGMLTQAQIDVQSARITTLEIKIREGGR